MTAAISVKPDHARLIGEITAEWSVVDQMLGALFCALMGVEQTRGFAVFNTLWSHRAKIEAVRAAGQVALADQPEQLAEFRELLDRIGATASRRNDFAHGLWGVSPTTGAVSLVNTGKPHRNLDEVSIGDLEAISDEVGRIVVNLHTFYLRHLGLEHLMPAGNAG